MAIWVIVPAAGIGTRMKSEMPKQYLTLNGQSVIAHTLQRLAGLADLHAIVVVLHPQDSLWSQHGVSLREGLKICNGGDQRCQSVLNGLYALEGLADADDWVLVHDAVRPCVRLEDIQTLLREIEDHPVGGLLGIPVSSTLKLANTNGDIVATVPRDDMWQASTPQAFRYGKLREILEQSVVKGAFVTDEAAAMEKAGYTPRLVRGGADNIKITYPEDLRMASVILQAQLQAQGAAQQ